MGTYLRTEELTSLGILRFEYPHGFTRAKECPNEVDADDALERLERHFFYWDLGGVDARVLYGAENQ